MYISCAAGIVSVLIMICSGACMYVQGPARGPAPHAKARGYRIRRMYRYYPAAQIYFDVKRSVYFFMSGGVWVMRAALPASLRVNLGPFVTMELDTDKPYSKHSAHARKYPPGQYRRKERRREREERERERRKDREERDRERRKEKERKGEKKQETRRNENLEVRASSDSKYFFQQFSSTRGRMCADILFDIPE